MNLTCNEKVEGSIPFTGTSIHAILGEIPHFANFAGVTPGLHLPTFYK